MARNTNDPLYYLVHAEKIHREDDTDLLAHFKEIKSYDGVKWGFIYQLPEPSWYPSAKEILDSAIELQPDQETFSLSVSPWYITLCHTGRAQRAFLDGIVEGVKRAFDARAQTSPSGTEPQESRIPLSNLESQPTIHGSEEVCQEGTDYG